MTAYLVTRPEHDDTTYYLSNWCKETISFAEQRGIKVLDLNREKAVREEVEARIKDISPIFIVFNGHGSETIITGHKNQPLIICGENESLLKSKIIYAISCRSAKKLGVKSIEAGAASYTGFDDDFIFHYEPNKISRPLQDQTAKMFLEPSAVFINSILKGNNVSEAKNKSESMMKESLKKVLSSDNTDTSMARHLWWDIKHFVSHGNLNATILLL